MPYTFQTFTFATRDQMLAGMVYWYFTADGGRSPDDVDAEIDALREDVRDPADWYAGEMISEMGLDEPPHSFPWEDDQPSHMAAHNYSREDVVEAIRRFLAQRPDRDD